ncbi:MAG: hypothetical protein P0Y59_14235 [Candidatus Sphingomonas phytovorans]|nr:hypothetical protein [Sphingomonas sp.]WEJ98109.1 MAG: hypothetical protein P0Y59_14235 [Sphingomonas sp.]
MTVQDRLNYLNIGLMAASCAVAWFLPFELFLLAYAVLGPLHYLTEISWLHDRRYFLDSDQSVRARQLTLGWLALVGIALAVMLYGVVAEKLLHRAASPQWEIGLFYLVFVSAALLIFTPRPWIAAGVIVLTGIGVLLFGHSPWYGLIAFFIITIVHVLVFTGAFLLLGALKTRSRSGGIAFAAFLLFAASFFLFSSGGFDPTIGEPVRQVYAPFETLNMQLIQVLGLGPGTALWEIYESPAGVVVMRLIAFAYTYHYLNWFSKTSVIRWHRISTLRAGIILALWLGALALYWHSYITGFVVLYSLSVLHVMLELPLNHQSFAGIGRELVSLFRPTPPAAPKGTRKRQGKTRASTRAGQRV